MLSQEMHDPRSPTDTLTEAVSLKHWNPEKDKFSYTQDLHEEESGFPPRLPNGTRQPSRHDKTNPVFWQFSTVLHSTSPCPREKTLFRVIECARSQLKRCYTIESAQGQDMFVNTDGRSSKCAQSVAQVFPVNQPTLALRCKRYVIPPSD